MSDESDSWLEGIGVDVQGIIGTVPEFEPPAMTDSVGGGLGQAAEGIWDAATSAGRAVGDFAEAAFDAAAGAGAKVVSGAAGAAAGVASDFGAEGTAQDLRNVEANAEDDANRFFGEADREFAQGLKEVDENWLPPGYPFPTPPPVPKDPPDLPPDSGPVPVPPGPEPDVEFRGGGDDPPPTERPDPPEGDGPPTDRPPPPTERPDRPSDGGPPTERRPILPTGDAMVLTEEESSFFETLGLDIDSPVSDEASNLWDRATDFAGGAFESLSETSVADFTLDPLGVLSDLPGIPTKKDVAGEPNPRADAAPTGFDGTPLKSDQDKTVIDGLSTAEKTSADRDKETSDAFDKAMQKVAEAALKKFLGTPEGKALKATAEKEADKIPTVVKIAVPVAVIASATAGLAANSEEFPISESPDLPMPFKLGPVGVSAKVTWKGPVDRPTESAVTFTFEIPLGKDEPRPSRQLEQLGGASGPGPSGDFRPPKKQGTPVIVADFDEGTMGVSKVVKAIAAHSEPEPGSGTVHVAYFFDDRKTTFEDATARAEQWRKSIEQMLDTRRYRVTKQVHIKSTGQLAGGFDSLGGHDVAIIYTPPG